jgi:hypothetical protein
MKSRTIKERKLQIRVGDSVKCIENVAGINLNHLYKITNIYNMETPPIIFYELDLHGNSLYSSRFFKRI